MMIVNSITNILMKKGIIVKRVTLFVIAVLLVFSIAACSTQTSQNHAGSSKSQANSGQGTSTKEPIKFGVASSITGSNAANGEDAVNGSKLAAKQINDAGGILGGRMIEIVTADEKGLPELGATVYKKLRSQGVKFISGTNNTSVAYVTVNLAKDDDVIYIVPAAMGTLPVELETNGKVSGINHIFGLNHTNAMFGASFHKWIKETVKPKTVALILENTDYGRNELKSLKNNWGSPGSPKIVATEFFETKDTNFSIQLTKIRELKPDALYVVAAGPSLASSIFRQADQLGIKATKLVVPGDMVPELVEQGGSAVEGVLSAGVYYHSLNNNEVNKDFVKAYSELFQGGMPSNVSELNWESITFLAKAIDKVGNTDDTAAISKTLRETTWESPRGTVTFNEKNRAQSDSMFMKVKNGQIVKIK